MNWVKLTLDLVFADIEVLHHRKSSREQLNEADNRLRLRRGEQNEGERVIKGTCKRDWG
jgi:hypothetical protein